jgi:hypothetical protein
MTPGDTLVAVNIVVNTVAALCYAAYGQWNSAIYWGAAVILTGSILWRSWQ